MTFQQIKLAVIAAGKNSISEAANEMFMAQSNASQMIKKLEEELGFLIFKRRGDGVTPTEEGYLFLSHAEVILREGSAIKSISSVGNKHSLRLGCTNFTAPVEAFIKFCSEVGDETNADLACVSASAEEGARELRERALDVVVTFFSATNGVSMEQLCREYKLKATMLKSYPFCVRLRADHPLIVQGSLNGSLRSLMKLGEYPYVDYCCTSKLVSMYNDRAQIPFGYSYRILVEERDTRLRITGSTNAFTLGRPLSASTLAQYGLTEVLIKDVSMTLAVLTRKGDEDLPDIQRYLKLLNDELEKD